MSYKVGVKVSKDYLYQGVVYKAEITFKRIRNFILRYGAEENSILVSCPCRASMEKVDSVVGELLPKLLKRKRRDPLLPYGEDWMYVLGEKKECSFKSDAERERYIKQSLLPIVESRVRLYEKAMGIKEPYRVSVKKMSSRFGSNSRRTHSLSFASCLYHYDLDVIDSVVVHELAHHYVFDHSKKFYNVVFGYCPTYKACRKCLRNKTYERKAD